MNNKTSHKSSLYVVITVVILGVLAIHFGIALALVNLQMPKSRVDKPKKIKPVEIELIKVEEKIPEPESEVATMKLSNKTSKIVKSRPQPKTDEEPQKTAVINNNPPIKKQPVHNQDQNKIKQTNHDNSQKKDNSNQREDNQDQGDNSKQNESRLTTPDGVDPLTTQQTQKVIGNSSNGDFEQQSGNSNVKNNETSTVQTAGGYKNSGSGDNKKESPQQPNYSRPQSFTINDAEWVKKPVFSKPNVFLKGTLTVVLRLTVDTQGKISSKVYKSSGNSRVDQTAVKQVNRAKLKPFTKNGQPVVGEIYLPVEYKF